MHTGQVSVVNAFVASSERFFVRQAGHLISMLANYPPTPAVNPIRPRPRLPASRAQATL